MRGLSLNFVFARVQSMYAQKINKIIQNNEVPKHKAKTMYKFTNPTRLISAAKNEKGSTILQTVESTKIYINKNKKDRPASGNRAKRSYLHPKYKNGSQPNVFNETWSTSTSPT